MLLTFALQLSAQNVSVNGLVIDSLRSLSLRGQVGKFRVVFIPTWIWWIPWKAFWGRCPLQVGNF